MIAALRMVIKRMHYPLEVMHVRALVCVLSAELSPPRRDDGGTRRGRRPRDDTSLGNQDRAGAGRCVSPMQAAIGHELAHGRDLHQGPRSMEVSLPGR